jgi:hypothetical protein
MLINYELKYTTIIKDLYINFNETKFENICKNCERYKLKVCFKNKIEKIN